MLKAKIRAALRIGIAPAVLILRVALLRIFRRLPRASTRPPAQIQRIFFSFPYHTVGDVILTLTLLDRIHDDWPAAEIDFAVGASMAPLVGAIPYVRRTFALPRARSGPLWMIPYFEIRNQTRMFKREIAGTKYDLAIAPRWDSGDSFLGAYLAYLTGAPLRCGYSGTADGGISKVDLFLTTAAKGGANEHESLRYMRLLGRCGLEPQNAISEQASQRTIGSITSIARMRKSRGENTIVPEGQGYVVFSPGAANGRRVWPAERLAEVGRALYQEYGLTAIVIGSPADASLCQQVASSIGESALSMAGKTDPLQMLDLIAGAELFLGSDSGPAHIAGGLGIPTLVVSPFPVSCTADHFNSPRRFRPAGPLVHVLQPQQPLAPCSPTCQQDVPHCILQISTETMLAAVHNLIGRKAAQGSASSDPSWFVSD